MSFVWKQRDSRLGGRRRLNSTVKESAPAISAIHVAATTCANLHFLTWKTSRPRSVQVHLASAKGGDAETDGERDRADRAGLGQYAELALKCTVTHRVKSHK